MPEITRVLSMDGGGIRGVIPGQILVELERRIQRVTRNEEARIADYFDLVAGTSTGGILACALLCPDSKNPGRPKLTASEVVDLYLERGDEIFDIPLWHRIQSVGGLIDEKYPAEELEEALEDYLGNVWLKDLLKPCLITAYDIKRRAAHFFTQHEAKDRPAKNFRLRDVARATSAAPTFFETARIKSQSNIPYPLIDGGVFANNPALCAYAEVRRFDSKPTAANIAMLSLGTGDAKTPFHYRDAKDWGLAGWAKPLIDIMMTGVAETVDFQFRQIYDAVEKPHQYLRINPALGDASPDLDNATPENLTALKEVGIEAAETHDAELSAFLELLVR